MLELLFASLFTDELNLVYVPERSDTNYIYADSSWDFCRRTNRTIFYFTVICFLVWWGIKKNFFPFNLFF